MKTLNQTFLIVACILFSVVRLHAQDLHAALIKLKEQYKTVESLHIALRIEVFQDSASSKPYFIEQADIKRKGTNYRYTLLSNELLMNDHFMIVVDRNSKELLYSHRDLKSEAYFSGQIGINIDSVFTMLGDLVFIGRDHQRAHYRIKNKKSEIRQIDLFLNEEKGYMEKIIYLYRGNQIASIKFEIFDVHPSFDENTFSETSFITITNGKVMTASDFRNYVLVGSEGD